MNEILYCKICGYTPLFWNNDICPNCKNWLTNPGISLHDNDYYVQKSTEIYGDRTHWREILIQEETSKNPEYNPNTTEHNATNVWEYREKERQNKMIEEAINKAQPNRPKCPTCQSTDIKKISTARKAVGATLFGLFSKTARSQFECGNCGYKW